MKTLDHTDNFIPVLIFYKQPEINNWFYFNNISLNRPIWTVGGVIWLLL